MNGFILLHRCLIDKPIWLNSTSEQKVILITLLMMATWKETEWDWNGKKFKLLPGQIATSQSELTKKCGKYITTQNIKTALKRFETLGFLTNQSTKQGRIITIENWRLYQDKDYIDNQEANQDLTNVQPTPNQPLTNDQPSNNKQSNNIKIKQDNTIPPIIPQGDVGAAEKSPKSDGAQRKKAGRTNRYEYTPEFEAFWAVYPRQADKVSGFAKFKECLKAGVPLEELLAAAKNYAGYVKKYNTEEPRILHAKTFLGPAKRYEEFTKGVGLFGQSTGDDRNVQGENAGKPDWGNFFKPT